MKCHKAYSKISDNIATFQSTLIISKGIIFFSWLTLFIKQFKANNLIEESLILTLLIKAKIIKKIVINYY